MKKHLIIGLFFLTTLFIPFHVQAQEVNREVQAEIAQILRVIVQAINNGTTETIVHGVSENARPELQQEIEQALQNKPINYDLNTKTITANDDQTYTVKGTFQASSLSENGTNWELSGIPVSFTFENANGSWWLLETNFHERLGGEFTLQVVGVIFAIIGGIIILGALFLFWKKRQEKQQSLNASV